MTFNRPQGGDDVDIQINIVTNETQLKRSDAAIKGFAQGVDRLEQGLNEAGAAASNMQKQQAALATQTKESITLAQRWESELAKVKRQDAIALIERDFVKATQSGQNLEGVLVKVEARLKAVGATEADVSRVLSNAASVGSGTGANDLTRLGVQLRGLPSVAIPGAGGLTTDAIGNITRLIGSISGPDGLPKLSTVLEGLQGIVGTVVKAIGVGPLALGGALVALTVILNKVGEAGAEVQRNIGNQIEAAQELNRLRITSTIPQVTEHLRDLNQEMEIAAADYNTAEEGLRQVGQALLGADGLTLGIGELQAILATMDIPVGQLGNAMVAAQDKMQEAKDKQNELSLELGVYNTLLYDNRVQQNTVNAELEEQNRLLEERSNQRGLNALRDEISLNSLSADALQKRITALAQEKEAIQAAIDDGAFTGDVLDQQQQRVDDITDSLGRFVLALPGKQEVDALAKAEEYRKQQMQETAALVEAYNQNIEASTQQRAEREAAILGKLNDDIVKAAEKAALDAEKALERLEQQRAKLGTDLARGERDANRQAQLEDLENRLKFQRDEAKSYRDHLRNLRDIRESAQAQEEDLGRSRDFAGLRRLRLETNRNLREETRQFAEQQAERELAYAQQIEDEQRRREFEHESRVIRYQDALQDAQEQYDREMALNARNQQRSLVALRNASIAELKLNNDKHRAALNMQYKAVNAELAIVSQGQAARLEMERRHQQALLAQAQALQIANFFGNLGGNLIKGLTGTTNNVNTTFNVNGGTGGAQQKNLEAFVDGRIAAVLARIG